MKRAAIVVDVLFKFIELVDVIRIRGRRNAIRGRREVEAASTKADQDQMIEIRISHFEAEGSVPPLHYTR